MYRLSARGQRLTGPLRAILKQATAGLDAIGARRAVTGGPAAAVRSGPRFTKDAGPAVAVADDQEAEDPVSRMQVRGCALSAVIEQDHAGRLATARLVRPAAGTPGAFIGLLFAGSGTEDEIVRRAGRLEVLRDIHMPAAPTGHLIALKVLAGRHQDLTDPAA